MTSCLTMYHTPHFCNFFFLFAGSETTGVVHRLSLLFLTHLSDSSLALAQHCVRPSPKCTYCALPAEISSGLPPSSRTTLQAPDLGLCSFPPPSLSAYQTLLEYRDAHGERESPRFSPCPIPPSPPPHTHSIHSTTPAVERLRPRQVQCIRAPSSARIPSTREQITYSLVCNN